MTEVCTICQVDILIEPIITFECTHRLHKKCYEENKNSLLICPLCRKNLKEAAPILNCCAICSKELDMDPSNCVAVISSSCPCLIHYECIKDGNKNCKNCNISIISETIEALTYDYISNGVNKWIGRIPKCRIDSCRNIGEINRCGYCSTHNNSIVSDNSIKLSLHYFIKYIRKNTKKFEIFFLLLEYMNTFHTNDNISNIDFNKIKKILSKNELMR